MKLGIYGSFNIKKVTCKYAIIGCKIVLGTYNSREWGCANAWQERWLLPFALLMVCKSTDCVHTKPRQGTECFASGKCSSPRARHTMSKVFMLKSGPGIHLFAPNTFVTNKCVICPDLNKQSALAFAHCKQSKWCDHLW